MTISFDTIPANVLTPFVTAEFNSSRAMQSAAALAFKALLIGQATGGTADANSLHRVTSADAVAVLAGRGSQLHRMAIAWFFARPTVEIWIGVLVDNAAAVNATGTITPTGTATGAGTISLLIGGNLVEVAVATGDTAGTIATAIAAAIGKHATGTITCTAVDAADAVNVAGVSFVATAGAVTPGDATFSIDTGNPEAAASLCSQIKAHAVASRAVRPEVSSNVVTVYARAKGTAGNSVVLTSTDGSDLAVTGSGTLAGGVGVGSSLPVHATVNSTVVTAHALNAGAVGNELDLRVNYQRGEELPAGVTLAFAQPSGGATNPTLTALITAMGERWFNVIAHPYTDATSLAALETELTSRAGPMRMIDGYAITAKDAAYATVTTLGESRNSGYSSIVRTGESPTPPAECAAHIAAVAAGAAETDPARPFQTLALPYIKAPAEADRDSNTARDLLLKAGVATMRVGAGDQMQIERLVSTYRFSAAGSPDTAYRDSNTAFTLSYLRYTFCVQVANKYPRHKLADDGTRAAAGQAIMTPSLGRAEAVTWFDRMEKLGLVEGIDQFKDELIVERDETDRNRLNFYLPPDLMNQLVVVAAQVGFRL